MITLTQPLLDIIGDQAMDEPHEQQMRRLRALEHSLTADIVAMLEGMKREPGKMRRMRPMFRNAVINEAIANAKALGEGRAG